MLLTRPKGNLRGRPSFFEKNFVAKKLKKLNPQLGDDYLQRAAKYKQTMEFLNSAIDNFDKLPFVYPVFPSGSDAEVRRLEKECDILEYFRKELEDPYVKYNLNELFELYAELLNKDKEEKGKVPDVFLGALKLLKFRYINNKTINQNTRDYLDNFGNDFDFMPEIHQSAERYILMDFVNGDTLDEYMHSLKFINSDNKNTIIKAIFFKLCHILEYFAEPNRGIIHGDLNPKNIIIKETGNLDRENLSEDDLEMYLIDFGVNYLLNEKIGSSRALTRARIYIAEEVLEDYNQTSIMSDIYSLGVILLELYNVKKDIEFDYRGFDGYLYNIRLEEPVIASILDDILAKNPKFRLFDLQKKYEHDEQQFHNIYIDLKRNFELE